MTIDTIDRAVGVSCFTRFTGTCFTGTQVLALIESESSALLALLALLVLALLAQKVLFSSEWSALLALLALPVQRYLLY